MRKKSLNSKKKVPTIKDEWFFMIWRVVFHVALSYDKSIITVLGGYDVRDKTKFGKTYESY